MNNNSYDVVYVTGHKNPDTDSIVSAIAYANLKQHMNINAYPCRLGEINNETKYILERFNFQVPMLLQDARSQLDEIDMDVPISVTPETTIFELLQIKDEKNKPVFAVVNHLNQLLGILTSSNLSNVLLGDTAQSIELLSKTPIEYINKTIQGRLMVSPAQPHINGKVSIPAISNAGLENYEITDRIVIIGNDTDAQLQCIAKGAGLLIIVWANNVAPMVMQAAKEANCAVILSGHGTMNTSRYLYYSTQVKELMTTNLVVFNKAEFVEDVTSKMIRSRFRSYPVVDDQNHIFGMVSRYHLLNAKNKKLILVDHNEMGQSVHGIEHADILEIIDHHRIGDISTSKPITFRNEIVGSTATIITKIYLELDIEISPRIAGILLGAMISDTLNFRSPTTTNTDIVLAAKLALIAKLDIEEYAKDIFNVSNSLKDKSIEDILTYDMKEFEINGKKVVISQLIMTQLNELSAIEKELQEKMAIHVKEKHAQLWVMVFTSIQENGSVMYAAGELEQAVLSAFPNRANEEHSFLSGVVSRKNQIVPKLSVAINQLG